MCTGFNLPQHPDHESCGWNRRSAPLNADKKKRRHKKTALKAVFLCTAEIRMAVRYA